MAANIVVTNIASKKVFLSLAVLTLAAAAFGQNRQQQQLAHSTSLSSAAACQSTYGSGHGLTLFEFCVTSNGNIAELQSPFGVEHIRFDGSGEGYGVCDYDNKVRYYDYDDGDSGNWKGAVITQPGGPNTFPLKVVRTSSDGLFTLTQTFSRNTGERIAKIAMTLKNNSSVSKTFILLRFANVNANNGDGGDLNNEFDSGIDASWAYNNLAYGVRLSAVTTFIEHAGFVDGTNDGPDPCSPSASAPPGQPFFGDGSVVVAYVITLPAGKSTTAAVEYKRF
jgi:hypothetical protein